MAATAQNPYSFVTSDSASKMRLFCGRTDDLNQIAECLRRNESIALFGERRIGKTFLLYCLRDLVNCEDPRSPPYQLADDSLGTQWERLCNQLGDSRAIYIDIQEFPAEERASHVFRQFLQKACKRIGLRVRSRGDSSLVDFLERVVLELDKRGQRLVILVDEIEDLKGFEDSHQVLVNIRSVIQTHADRLSFVFSGAERWHQDVKYGSSPLANNLRQLNLSAPDPQDIRQYLIVEPLSQVLTPKTADRLAHSIIETTGAKPWFVQMICYFLWQRNMEVRKQRFNRLWEQFLRDEVEEQCASHQRNAYQRTDDQTKRILKLLSVSEPLSVRQIARKLAIPAGDVFRILDDLRVMDKVRSQTGPLGLGSDSFRFSDKITRAYWRERAGDVPRSFPWTPVITRAAKWILTGILLAAALTLYLYAHPPLELHSIDLSDYGVEIWYPASVEESEEGTLSVVGHNGDLSTTDFLTITVTFSSDSASYEFEDSNRVAFVKVAHGEKRQSSLNYRVHPMISTPGVQTEVLIGTLGEFPTEHSSFTMEKRGLPIKKYLIPFQAVIVALVGVLTRKEIGQFVGAIVALASSGKADQSQGTK